MNYNTHIKTSKGAKLDYTQKKGISIMMYNFYNGFLDNLTVGATLVVLYSDKYSKREGSIKECEVVKIGRKYLTVKYSVSGITEEFHLTDHYKGMEKSDYTRKLKLFESREKLDEYLAHEQLLDSVVSQVSSNKLSKMSYENLKQLEKLLNDVSAS